MAFDKAKAIRAAEKFIAQGKIPAAIQEYRRIVECDGADFSALNTLGDLYARVNEKQEALACYQRVAEHYREQGFALKAVAIYKKITRFNADDHRTALALASLYEQQGLTADARAQYLVAADVYTRAGDEREALDMLRRIADLDPSDTKVRLRLAAGYAKQGMEEEAAEAYTGAGERLAARGEHERALAAFNDALALRPEWHAALQGMLAAHIILGTSQDAAEVLERAVAEKPRDVELHAMLVRAYVEAEDVRNADRAAEDLMRLDAASYPLFFDVARLYLQQGELNDAARLLGRVAEPALSGRQDATLLEHLQEALARDPEHLDALRLLVRVYTWQRDEERLRSALERLADAAESAGAHEDERRALAQLTRLVPDEERFHARLYALGGPISEDEKAADSPEEAPTFESFMLSDSSSSSPQQSAGGAEVPVAEFEWNTVASAPVAESESLFESNDAGGAGEVTFDFSDSRANAGGEPSSGGFQEIDFEAGSSNGSEPSSSDHLLLQELESVDFYIEQNYTDIARETLDMLERQYGAHAEIDKRRSIIEASAPVAATEEADGSTAAELGDPMAFDFMSLAPDEADAGGEEPAAVHTEFYIEAPAVEEEETTVRTDAQGPGIDPGLAALFDEFRESVEEESGAKAEADFDTHYQMGLAYREMGLLDQAVEEFQTAASLCAPGDGTPRYLQCCNLLGHCFIEKGMARPAVVWFRKGLEAPGHTEDEYQAIRYELGVAYELMGDVERAVEVFSEVYAIDVSYRGVADRLRELQKKRSEVRG